jgi:hypothetical protein
MRETAGEAQVAGDSAANRSGPSFRHRCSHIYFRAAGRLRSRRRIVVAAGPHPIVPWTLTWKIGRLLGLDFRAPGEAAGARFAYWFEFTNTPAVRSTPSDYFGDLPAINARCGDIRKSRVMRVTEEVFGYGYGVDPLAHDGLMAVKSEHNGLRDGRVVDGPLPPDELDGSTVYQRLIDTRIDGGEVEDFRVCIVGREIPYVLRKRRPEHLRFAAAHTEVRRVSGAFSEEEEERIIAFASRFGLDVGELDIARDRVDGRIYVLDANNTPISPPFELPIPSTFPCMNAAAAAFERQFLETDPDRW